MTAIAPTLTRQDYKVISLSLLGGALEVFDFIIFVFLSTTIANVFFPADTPEWIRLLESMTIFSVGYLARPLGGLLIAHFSDRYGRKHMFNFTVLFMAMPCLAMGLLPVYAQIGYWAPLLLLVARIIQGAALGGEVPNAWVFVAEHTPTEHRGFALGLLQAGLTFGYMLAALTVTFISSYFTADELNAWAWRIPFIVGGLLGFISLWLRRWLQETSVFIALQKEKSLSERLPLMDILRKHRRAAIPASLLTAVLTSAVIIAVVALPIILQKSWQFDAATTFKVSCLGILMLNIGCIIAGRLVDRFGAWNIFAVYSVMLAIGVTVMTLFLGSNVKTVLGCYLFLGLCCGVIAAVPAVMVQLFPPQVKVTGISLIYNLAYSLCSSTLPLIVLALYRYAHWTLAGMAWLVAAVGVMTFVFYRKISVYR
jgi:MFS family permease